ncbi:MAG: hypothetical protein FJY86_00555 [Candidatus Diapherotrites archaeon]|uniref:Large ribosomal subunit protein uL15 n=1 Tax=Candidatus Iainarchaeum sp. TaxID=3101447 RepID=A0A8T4C683_9ARCH|nr:hypothetical protein [Candidatus Diapherotrites archaeon]
MNMVVRKRRRANKQLGERTHGHGDTKNWRGSGNRGGVGRAGSHKHKFSKYWMTFGNKVRMHSFHIKGKSLNVGQVSQQIEKWMKQGKVTQEDDMIVIDGAKVGLSTLLGSGDVKGEWYVKNVRVTEKARSKIEEANGEIADEYETAGGETKVRDPSAGAGDAE